MQVLQKLAVIRCVRSIKWYNSLKQSNFKSTHAMTQSNQLPISVSELNKRAKKLLESDLGLVWLQGEISGFLAANSGHWYFSLKDSKAQVKCAMFRNRNQYTKIQPKNGDKLNVRARVTLYEPRGDYQLNVEYIEAAGIGNLQQQFDRLKQKLTSEGLFDNATKKPLPDSVSSIGIITSGTGAALHDMLTVLKRRNPLIKITLYPTLVQGQLAPPSITQQIQIADTQNHDVLIVGRGGGSIEDLWAFNEEVVARTVFQAQTPIISAVGHEVDFTIQDFVADIRAPTPSAAAELVSKDLSRLPEYLRQTQKRLKQAFLRALQQQQQHLDLVRLSLKNPQQKIQQHLSSNHQLHQRLIQVMLTRLHNEKSNFGEVKQTWAGLSPLVQINKYQTIVEKHSTSATQAIKQSLQLKQHKLAELLAQLDIVSPLATLKRGYTITRNADSTIVTSQQQIQCDDKITTQTKDGRFTSIVTNIGA
jgi:exodeoxyribonuclease VII large subunit